MDTRYEQNFLFFEEEGHKYNDTMGNEYLSVTTLIHDYYNNTKTLAETKIYNDGNCTKIIEEIEYNHIPHIN